MEIKTFKVESEHITDLKLDAEVKEIETFQKNIVAAILEMGKMAKDPKHGFDWYDYFCYTQNVMPALKTADDEKKKILEEYGLRLTSKETNLKKGEWRK